MDSFYLAGKSSSISCQKDGDTKALLVDVPKSSGVAEQRTKNIQNVMSSGAKAVKKPLAWGQGITISPIIGMKRAALRISHCF
jgi:hypothetical protein